MTHEELVEEVAASFITGTVERRRAKARIAIATVAEALMKPTKEMLQAMLDGYGVDYDRSEAARERLGVALLAYDDAMRASPLFPKEPRSQ